MLKLKLIMLATYYPDPMNAIKSEHHYLITFKYKESNQYTC